MDPMGYVYILYIFLCKCVCILYIYIYPCVKFRDHRWVGTSFVVQVTHHSWGHLSAALPSMDEVMSELSTVQIFFSEIHQYIK